MIEILSSEREGEWAGASRYARDSLGRGISFRTSSGLSTTARLAGRMLTVGVLFGDGDGGGRKGDVPPRKE